MSVDWPVRRRAFCRLLALAGLAATQGGLRAQTSKPIARIGLVMPDDGPMPVGAARIAQLRAALADLGWDDGRNIAIETRHAGVAPQGQRRAAAELKALPVALIIASGTTTIGAVRDGAPGVPVVMVNAGDPVGAGFVANLARPGGSLTGTSAAGEELLAKQLELLAAALPQTRRFGVLMNAANPANGFFFDALSARARQLGVQLERIEVSQPDALADAIARGKGGGLLVLGDPMFGQQRLLIAELTRRLQVPTIFGGRPYVAAGGLMSYLSSDAWHWRSAAGYVDKILKGAKPGDLPVAQPTTFELIVNLKTAKALGIALPASLLLRADEVIE
ncbi:MAG: ABC transporter substrate-binding protein [Burkholderiaceae bacterium]